MQICVYFGRDRHAQDVASSEMFGHVKRLDNFKMVRDEKAGCYCVEAEANKREFKRLSYAAKMLGCKVTNTRERQLHR